MHGGEQGIQTAFIRFSGISSVRKCRLEIARRSTSGQMVTSAKNHERRIEKYKLSIGMETQFRGNEW
ncbi:MAG: hypothetical protein ACI9VS_001262 [Candidatus Binatia bacterium]